MCIRDREITEDDGESILLHESASRDYLEYAIAVVKGRALPDVKDGQKPVQRRVLSVSYTHLDVYKRQRPDFGFMMQAL